MRARKGVRSRGQLGGGGAREREGGGSGPWARLEVVVTLVRVWRGGSRALSGCWSSEVWRLAMRAASGWLSLRPLCSASRRGELGLGRSRGVCRVLWCKSWAHRCECEARRGRRKAGRAGPLSRRSSRPHALAFSSHRLAVSLSHSLVSLSPRSLSRAHRDAQRTSLRFHATTHRGRGDESFR